MIFTNFSHAARSAPVVFSGLTALICVLWFVPATVRVACADEPHPDKSGYNLFNPTPDDMLRSFNTDRPTKANVPWTVDAGHYQVETDLVFFTSDRDDASRVTLRSWNVPDPIFKVGLTDSIQLDLVFSGLYNRTALHNRRTDTHRTFEGFGDVSLRTKVNLWGNEGGSTAFAVMPYVKLPTNTGQVGNNQVETGMTAPFAISAPLDLTVILMPSFDILKDVTGSGKHAHFFQLINVNRTVVENVTGYVEFYADENTRGGTDTFYTLDFGLAWQFAPDWQIDGGTYIGLNRPAPDLQVYIGMAHRF
jgi:hypothetical protein